MKFDIPDEEIIGNLSDNPLLIKYIVNKDFSFKRKVIDLSPGLLQFFPTDCKDINKLIRYAISKDVNAILILDNPKKEYKIQAIELNPWILPLLDSIDEELIWVAILKNASIIQSIHVNQITNEMFEFAIKKDKSLLFLWPNPTNKVVIPLIEANPMIYRQIKNPTRQMTFLYNLIK